MRLLAIVLFVAAVACGGSKKPAARQPGAVENKQTDLDKDKSERDSAKPDDADDHDAKRGGDPCEGGE